MFRLARSVSRALGPVVRWVGDLTLDGFHFLAATLRSRTAVSAEILFLRKQLAFYQEHQIRPRRLTDSARFSLIFWSRLFDWKEALVIVKPATLIGWHRQGFKLFWKWKCRVGRPRLPGNIRQLIVRMVRENPTWGEERVAAELSVKLRILVSPRTVRSYWPSPSSPQGARRTSSQHWRTFIHNHAESLVACDFLVAVTARFRVLYVFVVMEVGSRRILHYNVTAHPTAGRTVQQFREAFPNEVSVSNSRPRLDLFGGGRRRAEGLRSEGAAHAGPGTESECILRTADRNRAARVFGLPNPAQREASTENSAGVGDTLQPRPSAFRLGSRYPCRRETKVTAAYATHSSARVAG